MPCHQGYTLAEEEEDPLIFQHRQLRGQGDTLVSGPVEAGPMKKLHVSTTALQKVMSTFILGARYISVLHCRL